MGAYEKRRGLGCSRRRLRAKRGPMGLQQVVTGAPKERIPKWIQNVDPILSPGIAFPMADSVFYIHFGIPLFLVLFYMLDPIYLDPALWEIAGYEIGWARPGPPALRIRQQPWLSQWFLHSPHKKHMFR